MRSRHNRPVTFRANYAVIAAAEARARRRGTSLSAVIRSALMRELETA